MQVEVGYPTSEKASMNQPCKIDISRHDQDASGEISVEFTRKRKNKL